MDLDGALQKLRSPAFPGSYFLSFEGIEGAGKSTQIALLSKYLESQAFRVISLREPGGTDFGEKLRGAILDSPTPLHPLSETYLFLSGRAQLLAEVILPELQIPNTVLIVDRFIDSTILYQGIGRELGAEAVLSLHQFFPLFLVPHRTYLLRLSKEESKRRLIGRGKPADYFESEEGSFFERIIEGENKLLELFPSRIFSLDAKQKINALHQAICEDFEKLIHSGTKSEN